MTEIMFSSPADTPASSTGRLCIRQFGDSALLIGSDHPDKEARWRTAHSLARRLQATNLCGVEGVVATFETFTVEYDPLQIDAFTLYEWLVEHSNGAEEFVRQERTVEIPVVYGGDFGPDLSSISEYLGISEDDVVGMHASIAWRVAFNGAPAGAPMHEGNAYGVPIPRMSEPRVRVPAGSVALSGQQGTIYTIPSPGGWRLIGTTPIRMNNPSGHPFVVLAPGDFLRFRPITSDEYFQTEPVFVGDLL